MAAKLKTVHITLTPQIAELLEAEVSAGRFANLSEAVRNAAWKAFAEDPSAELREAFKMLDESPYSDGPAMTLPLPRRFALVAFGGENHRSRYEHFYRGRVASQHKL